MPVPRVLRLTAPSALALLATLLLAGAANASYYVVELSNGGTFQSRYPPRTASWDPAMIELIDEHGTHLALPRALVVSVRSTGDERGFGKRIDTTTVDLGFMPNDVAEAQAAAAAVAAAANPNTIVQFVEPAAMGAAGVPVTGLGGGGGEAPLTTSVAGLLTDTSFQGFPTVNGGATPLVNQPAPTAATGVPGGTPAPLTQPTATTTPPPLVTSAPTGTPPPFTTPTATTAAGTVLPGGSGTGPNGG